MLCFIVFRSSERIKEHVTLLREDILNDRVVGSYSHSINNETIFFSHSGFRQDYFNYLSKKKYFDPLISKSSPSYSTAELGNILTQHVNSQLKDNVLKCMNKQIKQNKDILNFQCPFNEEIFQAGEDRGGGSKNLLMIIY